MITENSIRVSTLLMGSGKGHLPWKEFEVFRFVPIDEYIPGIEFVSRKHPALIREESAWVQKIRGKLYPGQQAKRRCRRRDVAWD